MTPEEFEEIMRQAQENPGVPSPEFQAAQPAPAMPSRVPQAAAPRLPAPPIMGKASSEPDISSLVKESIAARSAERMSDREGLDRAYGRASDNRFGTELASAGSDIGYAIAGVKNPNPNGFDDLRKNANFPIQQEEASRKLRDTQRTEDPNSTQAIVRRKFLMEANNLKPGSLDGANAEDSKFINDVLTSKRQNESTEAYRLAMIDSQRTSRADARTERQEKEAKLSDKEVGDITDFDTSVSSVQSALGMFKPDYTGPFRGNVVPDLVVGGDESVFRSEVGKINDAYRKLITGAGANSRELRMLAGRLPNVTDTPEQFQAKAKGFIATVERNKKIYLGNQGKRGKNVAGYESENRGTQSAAPQAAKASKPPVTQNGHTYNWNEATGTYE